MVNSEHKIPGGSGLKRVITGLIAIPLLLLLIIYGSVIWFLLLLLIINGLALNELFGISVFSEEKRFKVLITSLTSYLLLAVYLFGVNGLSGAFLTALFFLFLFILFDPNELSTVIPRLGFGIFGIVYIGLLLSYLLMIRSLDQGVMIILFLLAMVWSNDTMAYYVGKGMGKKKLFPRVSPNKTVEGAAGGLTGGFLISILFKIFLFDAIAYADLLILPLLVGVVSQLGDLFESIIKRGAGVKDTGALLPGHGGMLDRIDSLLFAAPFLYYYSLWRLAG
ncbi:MAG: phosphatidate cytidylyltransferase [Thermodesulfobacteriota bacterium]